MPKSKRWWRPISCLFAIVPPVIVASGGCGDDPTVGGDAPEAGSEASTFDGQASTFDGQVPSDAASGGDADVNGSKVFCATGTTYDAGDAGTLPNPEPQLFGPTMAGCPGQVYFKDRATLCDPSCTPCTAAQWVALRGTTAPAYHYWTDDDLGYRGSFLPDRICFTAPLDAGGVEACEVGDEYVDAGPMPMRVCRPDPTGDPFDSPHFDPLGNRCNWVRCAYGLDASIPDAGPDADPPVFDYMGGCEAAPTAGTLCCCP